MKPPYFFMLSATSVGLNVIDDVEEGEEEDQHEVQQHVDPAGHRWTRLSWIHCDPARLVPSGGWLNWAISAGR